MLKGITSALTPNFAGGKRTCRHVDVTHRERRRSAGSSPATPASFPASFSGTWRGSQAGSAHLDVYRAGQYIAAPAVGPL